MSDGNPTPEQVYADALAAGLSDYEAREEAWPQDDLTPTHPRNGCRWCGVPERIHMQRWTRPAGWHGYQSPTAEQRRVRAGLPAKRDDPGRPPMTSTSPTPVRMVTLPATAAAVLITDAVDHLALLPEGETCCPRCCVLCKAIEALLNSGHLDDAVRPVALSHVWWQGGFHEGAVDRDWIAAAWAACPETAGTEESPQ